VGAYVRLSVEDRQRKGDSIETQQAIIRDYISERNDLELREVYIDNGLSGQSFDRPAFQRMKDDIESGLINCCITKDLSRLGRNAIDTGFYIENYFPKHCVRYIAITDNFDSSDDRSGGIMVSLKNMINETIALEAGRKIRAHHQILTREGGFSGAHAPYGHLKA
jgi:DNA invertase Pin-like site-specific DNA recombinase